MAVERAGTVIFWFCVFPEVSKTNAFREYFGKLSPNPKLLAGGIRASAPPRAALPGRSPIAWGRAMGTRRKPSGIPSAAGSPNRGASVSYGFPSRQRLGGYPGTRCLASLQQVIPAKVALTLSAARIVFELGLSFGQSR